jgi:integrase
VAGLPAAPRIRAKEGRTLTVDQARQLLEAAAGCRFEVAVVLALAYGMRRGEVLGLHWSALDWKTGTLRVTHGVKRVRDRDASGCASGQAWGIGIRTSCATRAPR